jgi:hypothetical protein
MDIASEDSFVCTIPRMDIASEDSFVCTIPRIGHPSSLLLVVCNKTRQRIKEGFWAWLGEIVATDRMSCDQFRFCLQWKLIFESSVPRASLLLQR